jgi:hypothetical protein
MRLILIILFIVSNSFSVYSQNKTKPISEFKCLTYLYNITNDGSLQLRDICFTVELEVHIDMNEYNYGKYDKTMDIYKYNVRIVDNEKKTEWAVNVGFNKVEDDSEKIQYNCIYSDNDIKALIYYKKERRWGILINDNQEFKYFSFYSGYRYTDCFGVSKSIKSKSTSRF